MLCLLTCTALMFASLGIQFAYPIFKTWETIKSNNPSKQWLSYWVVYGVILLIETLAFDLSSTTFTLIVKLLFCLWLIHPEFLGASLLHDNVLDKVYVIADQSVGRYIKPLLNKKEKSE